MHKSLLILVGAALVVPSSAAAERNVVNPSCGIGGLRVRPSQIVLTCADGNARLERLRWSTWGRRTARARGLLVMNDCVPYCARGHFRRYRASVVLYRPRRGCSWGGEGVVFRAVLIRAREGRRLVSYRWPLVAIGCSDLWSPTYDRDMGTGCGPPARGGNAIEQVYVRGVSCSVAHALALRITRRTDCGRACSDESWRCRDLGVGTRQGVPVRRIRCRTTTARVDIQEATGDI